MPVAAWKDLCIDATDAWRIADFWGQLLGRSVEHHDDGDAVLRGELPEETIWVNRVPEPKVVKQRVHLDVEAPDVASVLALGASLVLPAETSGLRWNVLADPEGGELCVFVHPEMPTGGPARLAEVILDTADPVSARALAGWWAEVLGGTVHDDDRGFSWVQDVPGLPFDALVAVPVPEPKTVKNRIHWDLTSAHLPLLIDRGATVLAPPSDDTPWHVCADPQGNEFCVFAAT